MTSGPILYLLYYVAFCNVFNLFETISFWLYLVYVLCNLLHMYTHIAARSMQPLPVLRGVAVDQTTL